MVAASDFEFKYRFWIFGLLFWVAFSTYAIDRQTSGVFFAERIARWSGTTATATTYRIVFAIAAFFCVVAAALRTWGTAFLNSDVMVDMRLHTTRLVADGPYRYVRNPLYLGNVFLAVGFGLMSSRIGFVVLVVGMLIYSYRLILREEAGIAASQGESYRRYCATVPRMFPSLAPKVSSSGTKPRWGDGLLGETFMWLLAISVIAFAVTLNQRIFFIVLGSAFGAYAICYAIIRMRQKKGAAEVAGSRPDIER